MNRLTCYEIMCRGTNHIRWYVLICFAFLTACTAFNLNIELQPSLSPPQIRGMWVHNRDVQSRQAVDQLLEQAVAGNFNTLFVQIDRPELISFAGTEHVAPSSEAMDYLIDQAHHQGLSVHAWFAVGPVVDFTLEPGPFMRQHPDWIMVNACGTSGDWFNLASPEAFEFMKDFVMESVRRYDMDGLHLDYVRYPGGSWSFDDYSAVSFAEIYGSDLDVLRQSTLPAYAYFDGRPLMNPSTAKVLATFDNGYPALLLNQYGRGQVLIFNWNVLNCQVGAINEIMQRALQKLNSAQEKVYLLDTGSTTGFLLSNFYKARAWLRNLEVEPIIVRNDELDSLPSDGILVLNIYRIDSKTAQALADYVWRGGDVIFLDGPVLSMQNSDIQTITGMKKRGSAFAGNVWLRAVVDDHALVPTGSATWNAEIASQWEDFRRNKVTQFVAEIREEMTAYDPDLVLSAAVFRTPTHSKSVSQAWDEWLTSGLVDFVVPMAYVDTSSDLLPLIAEWQTLPDYEHKVIPGLTVSQDDVGKSSQQVIDEITLIQKSGARGTVLFSFGAIDADLPEILAEGPFAVVEGELKWQIL